MVPVLELRKVNLSYEKKIFQDLNLKIYPGDKVVFIGSSGIGKTSLFKIILGFINDYQGEILFSGEKVSKQNIWKIRSQIAYIDQDVSFPEGKVANFWEYVFSLKANQKIKPSLEERENIFTFLELPFSVLGKKSEEVSGGERQRLALAIALLLKRKIFLLDEATSSLDRKLKKKVVDYFLNQKSLTVLSISHDSEWLDTNKAKVFNLEQNKWQI